MSALTEAHITAQERLRLLVASGVARAWQDLPGYDEEDVGPWLARVVPFVLAAQRQSMQLTEAFVARAIGRRPLGLDPADVVGAAARNGVAPETVYRRPFVTVWSALQNGTQWEDAVAQGLHRATSTAQMDVQLASRQTFNQIQRADPSVRGYKRVPDAGACAFCRAIAGAFVKSADASPLHNHCGCTLEPVTGSVHVTPTPDTVAVHEHGELGAVLTDPAHDFTSEAEIA